TRTPSGRASRSMESLALVMARGTGGSAAPHHGGAAAPLPDQIGRSVPLLVVRFPDERVRAGGQRAAAAVRVVVVRQGGLDLVDHGVVCGPLGRARAGEQGEAARVVVVRRAPRAERAGEHRAARVGREAAAVGVWRALAAG